MPWQPPGYAPAESVQEQKIGNAAQEWSLELKRLHFKHGRKQVGKADGFQVRPRQFIEGSSGHRDV
jgi:hypothetical protein